MRTYKTIFTEGMTVKFSKPIKEQIHQLATDANISQGEFVRDAVDYYLNILTTAKQKQDYTHTIINSIDSDE